MKFLIMILFFVSMNINAESMSFQVPGKLSDTQQAQIQKYANELAANSTKDDVTPEKVKEWTSLVNVIGDGFVQTAHKLGVEANEFIKTPVGLTIAFTLVWNYMGNDMLGIAVGFCWFTTFIPIWVYFLKKSFIKNEMYETDENNKSFKRKLVEYHDTNEMENIIGMYMFCLLVIVVIGIFIIF